MGISKVDIKDYLVDLFTFGTACIKIECKEMTKQEQIAQLKQTIQDAKEQVERLEKEEQESKFPEKLIPGSVISFRSKYNLRYLYVVCKLYPDEVIGEGYETFLLQNLAGRGRWASPQTFQEIKDDAEEIKVLANTVEEYYAKR